LLTSSTTAQRSPAPIAETNLRKISSGEELRKAFVRELFAKTSPLEELLDDRANEDLTN
jgi:hypothetical protein